MVALFTRAWIEMMLLSMTVLIIIVALFTRAWIEICVYPKWVDTLLRRPFHEGVD